MLRTCTDRVDEQRLGRSQSRVPGDFGERGRGADPGRPVFGQPDAAQLVEAADADHLFRARQPLRQAGHQVGAAGQDRGPVAGPAEQVQRVREAGGTEVFERRQVQDRGASLAVVP